MSIYMPHPSQENSTKGKQNETSTKEQDGRSSCIGTTANLPNLKGVITRQEIFQLYIFSFEDRVSSSPPFPTSASPTKPSQGHGGKVQRREGKKKGMREKEENSVPFSLLPPPLSLLPIPDEDEEKGTATIVSAVAGEATTNISRS